MVWKRFCFQRFLLASTRDLQKTALELKEEKDCTRTTRGGCFYTCQDSALVMCNINRSHRDAFEKDADSVDLLCSMRWAALGPRAQVSVTGALGRAGKTLLAPCVLSTQAPARWVKFVTRSFHILCFAGSEIIVVADCL